MWVVETYFVWSSGAVAICLNVPLRGMVGWETMYAATPTWTPVDTTSSVAQSAAATSAMIGDDWEMNQSTFLWLVPGMNACWRKGGST